MPLCCVSITAPRLDLALQKQLPAAKGVVLDSQNPSNARTLLPRLDAYHNSIGATSFTRCTTSALHTSLYHLEYPSPLKAFETSTSPS